MVNMANRTNGTSHVEDEFKDVPKAALDSMYTIKEIMEADKDPKKVNLGPGTYRDPQGKPWPLPSYQLAAERLIKQPGYDHEYIPITGYGPFLKEAKKLMFGQHAETAHLATLQTAGGTGAVHLGAEFLKEFASRPQKVYISDPTWVNHHAVFQHVGWETTTYRYYDEKTRLLDFDGMTQDLTNAPEGSIVVLHAVGHNPTGCDPSVEQWKALAELFEKRNLYAFFDCAYLGFASGSLITDRQSIAIFMDRHLPMLVCQSFSKNAGLYGERVGALHVVCGTDDSAARVLQQLKVMARKEFSTCPKFGAELVAMVCADPELFAMWERDVKHMADRILEMRAKLVSLLKQRGTPGDWSHITKQKGMFCYTGFSEEECWKLIREKHIYVAATGRMMMAGLNQDNWDFVADAFDSIARS